MEVIMQKFIAKNIACPLFRAPCRWAGDMIKLNINGFIAGDFSDEELVKQINNFLSVDKDELERIRLNNINEFQEKYSIERCAQKYIELYNKNCSC